MEFVVVGWTDPAGSPSHIGALLLGYYTEDGRLHYAGRAGTGMTAEELSAWRRGWPRCRWRVPLAAPPPPRDNRIIPIPERNRANAGLSQPAASEEAAFCCSTRTSTARIPVWPS